MMQAKRSIVMLSLLVGACGWWPWSRGDGEQRVGPPPDATVYRCDEGKQLIVRFIDGRKSAVIMLPEREYRVDAIAGEPGTRYSNGRSTLVVDGNQVWIEEGNARPFANCAVGAKS